MLEYLRNASNKPIAKVLIGILTFSFVGWGVAEWIFGNVISDDTLVRVGRTPVSIQQFNLARTRELATMSRDEMRRVYTDAAAATAFQNRLISKITTETMTENRAADLGYMVSDARIAQEIRHMPEFQQGGHFSSLAFDTVLNNAGYSEAEFADLLRKQILRQMVLGAIGAPVAVPQFAVDAAYRARYATRDIEYATVRFADFKKAMPTDDQLREFYAKNPQVIPEMRTISYVLVPAQMDKPDSYGAAYDIAVKVEDDIIGGASLHDAAARHGAKYGNLKSVAQNGAGSDSVMTAALITRAFDMGEATESELIETEKGFLIMRVDAIAPSHNAEFDAVKKNLVSDWVADAQRTDAYVKANDILVDVNAGQEMRGKKSATVSRASGAPVAVLAAAFNAPAGTNTIVPDKDAFYVLSIKAEKMPQVDTKKMSDLRREMQTGASRELIDDYNSFLLREYPVKMNEKLYRRFLEK